MSFYLAAFRFDQNYLYKGVVTVFWWQCWHWYNGHFPQQPR